MKQADIEVGLLHYSGTDKTVASAARVSFHKEASNYTYEQNDKLISYLARHKHLSPFNHCFLSFRVKAPIFVARQLQKHRFMPWNEVSRRYVDEEPEVYWPNTWRAKAENVKQGSSDERCEAVYEEPECELLGKEPSTDQFAKWHIAESIAIYNEMLKSGVAPEQARMVLPQNTMTEWWWSGTLGAFADMLRLRLDPHTQYESRIVAKLIHAKVEELFPVSIGALLNV